MVVAKTYATDRRVRREAESLAREGFAVEILCWDREGERSFAETLGGCLVRNVRFGKTNSLAFSKLYYLIAAVLFQIAIFLWVLRQVRKLHKLVLHAHDFNTLLVCVVAKRLLKEHIRLVYDCHESTPGVYQEWYGPLISGIVGRLERVALSNVDAIIAANEEILRNLGGQASVPAAVVYCSPAIGEVHQISRTDAKRKLGLAGLFVVLFSGQARPDYDFRMMLDAARDLKRDGFTEIRFVFTGPIVASLINTVIDEGLQSMFDFRGLVPSEDVLLYFAASDLCFMVTRDLGLNTKILTPIKLFESIACGVPVVARNRTLAAQIVRDWGFGIVIDPARDRFSNELIRLKQDRERVKKMSALGRDAFRLTYNWDLMQAKLFELYATLLSM